MSGREIPSDLLEILVCPLTRQPLRLNAAGTALLSDAAALAYPIRDGIPILVIEEARPLETADR